MAHVQTLASLVPTNDDIVGEINTLEEIGLLEATMDDGGRLIQHCFFASASVRDVVYNAMSIAQKTNLHRNCVELLQISLFRSGLMEMSRSGGSSREDMVTLFDKLFVIAEHCKMANQEVAAIDYYEKCAALAYDLSGYDDAMLMLEKCKDLAEAHDQQLENRHQEQREVDQDKEFMTLHQPKWDLVLGKCCVQTYQWNEAREYFTASLAQLTNIRDVVRAKVDAKANSDIKNIHPSLTRPESLTSLLKDAQGKTDSTPAQARKAASSSPSATAVKKKSRKGPPLSAAVVGSAAMLFAESSESELMKKGASPTSNRIKTDTNSDLTNFLTSMAQTAGLLPGVHSMPSADVDISPRRYSASVPSAKVDLLIAHVKAMLESLHELERAVETRINNVKGQVTTPPSSRIFQDLEKEVLQMRHRAFVIGLRQGSQGSPMMN